MKKQSIYIVILFCLFILTVSCGGNDSTSSIDEEEQQSTSEDSDNGDELLTEKLIGTPFEGMIIGDDIAWCNFVRDEYLSLTVDEFPIPVFLALFTANEEKKVKDGIELANDAIGFEALEVIEEWQDDARAIYKVSILYDEYFYDKWGYEQGEWHGEDEAGMIHRIEYRFNDKDYAETIVPDWSIEIADDMIYDFIVAHELGHAFGLIHYLIDYENDTRNELEERSVMDALANWAPTYNDYNFMMQKQGEIFFDHLEDSDAELEGMCDDFVL